jgi:serine/threonine protein kinase
MQKGKSITLQQGTYTLQESLARGGQGTIWKVIDNKNQPYALKVVNRYKIESSRKTLHTAENMQRLIYYASAEIDFLISLDNSLTQHIVVCLDHGIIKYEGYDLPAFTMPFYQQEDLSRRIKSLRDKDESISYQLWLRWFRQLMLALQSIQIASKNDTLLVHRDIKPANCLLDNNADLLLIDFGIVRENSKTGTTSIVYAYGYCAPEQRLACYETDEGDPHYYITPAVDIYSAAALMHEIVAGDRQAQKELKDNRTKRLHDRVLPHLNEKSKGKVGKVGKLGKVGGLTSKEQANLQQTLSDLFTPTTEEKKGKTMVLHQPALPNYQHIGEDAMHLIADMLAPWPDDRPDVSTVLQRLDRIEATLQPELQQLRFSNETLDVLIGQDLVVDFVVKGTGLPHSWDWLHISLDQSPLEEKPPIKTINAHTFQLQLPVFSELRQHSLRLTTQYFDQEKQSEVIIEVLPDANYLWTTRKRLTALKMELRPEWLDQWEQEANDVDEKYPLLAALTQLQQHYPDQSTDLQARYQRINTPPEDNPLPVKKIATVLLALGIVAGVGLNWEHLFGGQEKVATKLTPDKPAIIVNPQIKRPDLSAIETDFQSNAIQTQRKAWRKLNAIIADNKDYNAATTLKETYENETVTWRKSNDQGLKKRAFIRLQAMAEEGEKKAQYLLALHYLNEKNMAEGKRWTKKAADQGHKSAKKTLQILESRQDLF